MRRHRYVLSLAVLVVVLSVGAGCGGDRAAVGPRVLVIGDSITEMSRGPVAAALAADGWAPTVEAVPGSDIADWLGPARDLVRRVRPAVVVVELGTNQRGDEARVGRLVDALMRDLRRARAVLWCNVQEGKRMGARRFPPHPEEVNAALSHAEDRWPALRVLDFNAYFADRPQWHTLDGLHPNERGQAALARFVTRAVDRVGSPRPPTTPSSAPAM